MKRFDIYSNGSLVESGIVESDVRNALCVFATANGIHGPIRRDGGGLLYVGDEQQGRYRARVVIDPDERAAWNAKYPHSPFGIPTVIAAAIEGVGGL